MADRARISCKIHTTPKPKIREEPNVTERYLLEGTWSGFRPTQRHVVHREVVRSPQRIARLRGLQSIVYDDGTTLTLTLRPMLYRESVHEISSYASLIRDAETRGVAVVHVLDLCRRA